MRFCCQDTGMSFSQDMSENEIRLKQLHDFGFRVVGTHHPEEATDTSIGQYLEILAKYDMVYAMSPTGYQPAHPDPEIRKEHHGSIRKVLKNVQKLGGDLIHIAGGSYDGGGWWYHPKNFTQQGLDELVDEMKKLAPYAEDAGVCIAPETTQWCILYNVSRMKEFVDRVNSPCVKVTFDVVNHMLPERIVDSGRFFRCVVDELGERIGQLHVKDAVIESGNSIHISEAPLGTGPIDHQAIMITSNELEPWKLFSLEHFNSSDIDLYAQIENGYNYFHAIAERIGHTWTDPNYTKKKWQQDQS